MDDSLAQIADDLATLTPDGRIKLEQRIVGWEYVVKALHVLAARPYFTPEQAELIRAEATELEEKDIAPMRAALRDEPLATILQATVEELGDDDGAAKIR
jgi:hypothetical protein